MSRTKNLELSSWKDVLARLRREETTWRGLPLSRLDHETYTEGILMWAMVLNDLSNRYQGFGTYRDHVNFATFVASVDVSEVAAFLSDAVVAWRDLSCPTQQVGGYVGFKHRLIKDHPLAGRFLAPIKEAVALFLEDPRPSTFRPVYQFLSFLTHLSLVDIDLLATLEDEYCENERRLAAHHLPDFLVQRMTEVMTDWLRDCVVDEHTFIPQHGPGGVAELPGRRDLYSKHREVSPDQLIKYVFRKHAGVDADSYAYRNVDWARCRVPVFGDHGSLPTGRESRVVFVPKSMKTRRVISMEPTTLQFFQKGVDRIARECVRQHRYLSSRIDFNDQSLQCQAAIDASSKRDMATVDLSAASDSVSFELVKRVFRYTTLFPFLVALRSRSAVLPSGRVVELTKYAPMGSSMTFPIQTLIFACVAECTSRYVHHTTGVLDTRFRVYGDDIIVPNICLDDLVSNLRLCGFRINEDKTYAHDHRFRESCGCDAYDGVDVTPMRIGRKFSARRVTPRTPGVFAAHIDMANASSRYEFSLLRRYLVDKLVHGTNYLPIFSEDGRYGVATTSPTNFRLPRKWNWRYQRYELRAGVVVSKSSVASPDIVWNSDRKAFEDGGLRPCDVDDCRYYEWLRAANQRSTYHEVDLDQVTLDHDPFHSFDDIVESRRTNVGSTGTYLSRRWINDPS